MVKIKVKIQNDIEGDLEDLELDSEQTVREVIENFCKSHKIEEGLSSNSISCEIGNNHINIASFDKLNKQVKELINEGDYLVLRSFSKKFEEQAFTMTDPTKGECLRGFSNTAPEWRIIRRGLNVFAKCLNPTCKANGKIVIVNKGQESVEFATGQFDFKCPMCKAAAQPKTVAFYMCKYKIYGQKMGNGGVVNFGPIIGDANNRKYHTYYDPETNRDAMFFQYKVEIPEIY